MKTILTGMFNGYGLKPGDIIEIRTGRLPQLKKLLTKPRIKYVAAVSDTAITIYERRMTWKEWRAALWNVAAP